MYFDTGANCLESFVSQDLFLSWSAPGPMFFTLCFRFDVSEEFRCRRFIFSHAYLWRKRDIRYKDKNRNTFLSCEIVFRGIKAKRWKRMIKGKSILSHESFVYIFKDGHLIDIIPSQTITMFTPADSGKRFL